MPPPRFLIDENLSVALPALAHAAGFECQHVNELGLRTKDDAILMERIIAHDWTLVTNNWREFLAWKMRCTIIIEPGPANFSAYAPDFPGCVAAADTALETITLMRDALEMHVEDLGEQRRKKSE